MLKTLGHTFMLFAVLLSTTGISLHKHYSGGNFYSFALYTEAESCCQTDCDCCTDEVEFLQLDADFLCSPLADIDFKNTSTLSDMVFYFTNNSLLTSEFQAHKNSLIFQNLSPPKNKDIQLFTLIFRC
jgi:hypothetical protein